MLGYRLLMRATRRGRTAAILLSSAALWIAGAPARGETVAARVNGTPISRAAVQEVVDAMQALEQKPTGDPAERGDDRKRALDSLIRLELLYQESQRRGISVSDAAIDAEIARTKQHFGDDQAYEAALRAKRLSAADVRRETNRTMAVNRLLEGVVWKDIRISDEQMRDFYDRHRDEFQHPADTRARHILIRLAASASPADKQRALKRAAELRAQLDNGADFAALAAQHSDDKGTAAQGGDLGYFGPGELQSDFEAAVQSLRLHEPSQPVLTDLGYHIIEVTERRKAGIAPFESVREQIRAELIKREKQNRQTALVEELRAKAKIDYTEP
jgi:parvulin-like peptidyl-prolyl isomerase